MQERMSQLVQGSLGRDGAGSAGPGAAQWRRLIVLLRLNSAVRQVRSWP
jgi:hypothetical protein